MLYDFTYARDLEVDSYETESRVLAARGWGWEGWGGGLMGTVSSWEEKANRGTMHWCWLHSSVNALNATKC